MSLFKTEDICSKCAKRADLITITQCEEPACPHRIEVFKPDGSTPEQYGLPENARELQDLIEYRNMNFAWGNIFKACYRNGTCSHSDSLRDLRKIIWFAERELARLEKEES
jgi:hypothetical protein